MFRVVACAVLWLAVFVNFSLSGDRIVLRDLTLLEPVVVVSFDEDGLLLDREMAGHEKLVTWDEIESCTLPGLSPEKQQSVATMLRGIGEPLYRIRYRLKINDVHGVLEPAAKLNSIYRTRSSRSAAIVSLGLLRGRMAAGPREDAVAPWLHVYDLLRQRVIRLADLPGPRLELDASTALNHQLEPVWFDEHAARAALPVVQDQIRRLTEPVPEGAILYAATLAIAARDFKTAAQLLGEREWSEPASQALAKVVELQLALAIGEGNPAPLTDQLEKMPVEIQPLALYWIGQAQRRAKTEEDRQAAWLTLLRIPALHGARTPLLSSVVLEQLAGDTAEETVRLNLQREILSAFPATPAARKLRAMSHGSEAGS